jgi:uncharacterized membrane protein
MAQVELTRTLPAGTTETVPAVRTLQIADLRASLAAGWADFRAAPTQLFFLCVLYPVAALVFGRMATGDRLFPLLYPVASGFALVGPLAAVGLYEISRRRERGQEAGWRHAFDVLREPGFASVTALGVALVVLFVLWLGVAQALYGLTLGKAPMDSMQGFDALLFGTTSGWELIVLGNLAGLVFAAVALTTSIFSIPLALDRATPPVEAIRVSVAAVARNPGVIAVWGVIVGVLLFLGSLPAFIGLAVVMPVLGHATWHLYRRAIA